MDGGIERQTRSSDRLSDRSVKSFIAKTKAGTAEKKKLSDGGGLYMALRPPGRPYGASSTVSAARSDCTRLGSIQR